MATPGNASFCEQILAITLGRKPTCGASRLVVIDGPSGAGKSQLCSSLIAHLDRAHSHISRSVLHLEDLYHGWDDLPQLAARLSPILHTLASGRAAEYIPFDWSLHQPGPPDRIQPADLVVVEGVGAAGRAWSDLATTLVWMTRPDALERAVRRDGEANRAYLKRWHLGEQKLFARERPWERADLVVASD